MKPNLASGFALPSPPKRTAVPEPVASKFTKAEEPPKAPPASASRLRRAELGERLVVYLPPELATELRVRCAKERRSLSDAVTAAVEAWARSASGT
jgi:hypothetical protein